MEKLYYLKKSKVHGTGIFAARDIKKDEKIIEYIGEKITVEEGKRREKISMEKAKQNDSSGAIYTFEFDDEYYIDGDVPENDAKYINHSCNGNCESDIEDGEIWIYAKNDIAKDDELTYDYGFTAEEALEHPCRCSSEGCIGYIVDSDEKEKLKKLLEERKLKQ